MNDADQKAFWPKYFLAHRALASEDVTSARKLFGQLPRPETHREVKLYSELSLDLTRGSKTYADTLEDLRHLLSCEFDDGAKSSMIERFASRPDDARGSLAVALLREYATRLNPSDLNTRFNLAHQLGSQRGLYSVSYYQYKRVANESKDFAPSAENNIAILCSSRGLPALSYDFYSKSIGHGNKIASANTAMNLTAMGYLDGAADVLSNAATAGAGDDNIIAARERLRKAKEKMAKDGAAFSDAAKQDQGQFSHFASVCIHAWSAGARLTAGRYVAGGEKLVVIAPDSGAPSATLSDGGKSLACELAYNGVCYEGAFHEENAVPNSLTKRALISPSHEEADVLSAIVYNGISPNQRIEQFTLTKKDQA